MKYATELSACFDIEAAENTEIYPGDYKPISTGVYVKDILPPDMALRCSTIDGDIVRCIEICTRSGLAAKEGICALNAPGIVDADYPGEIMVILANFGKGVKYINKGDRIAQARIMEVIRITSRISAGGKREGGLGSTGK